MSYSNSEGSQLKSQLVTHNAFFSLSIRIPGYFLN